MLCCAFHPKQQLTYTIVRDFSGRITSASAQVTLGVVEGVADPTTGVCSAALQQTFGVEWNTVGNQKRLLATNQL